MEELVMSKDANVYSEYLMYTPLHVAVMNCKIGTVRTLIGRGADVNEPNADGETALHLAIQERHKDIVQILVEHGANVNLRTRRGKTPLHSATVGGQRKVCKLLIQGGANIDAKDANGETALHLASQERHKDIVQILVEHGADVNLRTKTSVTPLQFAARGRVEICKLLIQGGANIDAKNANGETALHIAIQNSHKNIVEILVEHGADVNLQTVTGQTPLHFAAECGQIRIMKILLNSGVNIDSIDENGNTALHLATCADQYEAVLTLIENGSNVNIVNKYHETALQSQWFRTMSHDKRYVIQQQLFKMQIASLDVNNGNVENTNLTTDINWQSQFQKKCIEEIQRMKSTKINGTILTFHDILTKRIDQIALYARNKNVVQVLKRGKYQREFPTYEDIIRRRFKRGMVRKKLFDKGVIFFRRYFSRNCDLHCIQGILNYLSNKDLTNLRDACKNVRSNINDVTKRETL